MSSIATRLISSSKAFFSLTGIALGLCGCRNVSTTPVGTHLYAPLAVGQDVAIYSREADIAGHFEVLAIIDFNDPGKYQVMSLGNAIPAIKEQARAVGANGVIVDESHPVKSGIISTGIHVSGRAIRVGMAAK